MSSASCNEEGRRLILYRVKFQSWICGEEETTWHQHCHLYIPIPIRSALNLQLGYQLPSYEHYEWKFLRPWLWGRREDDWTKCPHCHLQLIFRIKFSVGVSAARLRGWGDNRPDVCIATCSWISALNFQLGYQLPSYEDEETTDRTSAMPSTVDFPH